MKVTIVGCGALGSLLAFKLVRAGIDVGVCQRPGKQFDAIRDEGITFIDRDGKAEKVNCMVESGLDDLPLADLVLVLVKAYQTEDAATALKGHVPRKGFVLTLQNGLGNAETLARVIGEEHVAAGTCTYGAHRIGPGRIAWGGDGLVRFGPWKAGEDLSRIEALMQKAGIETRLERDPRRALWEKVILNASVNTVSALTRLKNGQILESPEAVALMRKLVEEGVRAAHLAGEAVETEPMWLLVRTVLGKTANNRTSMLQDVENKRKTEVDAIVGTLVDQARENGETLARLETVYALVKSLHLGVLKRHE